MSRYVAFLRGMNLGRRRITNPELCACFDEMGYSDVSAFLASGNVLFGSPEADVDRLGKAIEEGLRRALDYEVPTFVRSAAEVKAIASRGPFEPSELAAGGKPQVVLLAREPARPAREAVLALETEDDRLHLHRRELYWLPSGSILDSKLDFKLIERTIGPTTTRTLRTIERLAAKLA